MQMLRKSYPFWVAAVTLFVGCDFFSTRDILPKPPDIRALQGLFKPGDSVGFYVVESLRESGSPVDKQVLSKRRLMFTFEGDTVIAGDSFKVLSLRITEDPSGNVIEKAQRLLRFSGNGLELSISGTGGGARFYPLKVGVSANGLTTGASLDTTSYLALPAVFSEGWQTRHATGPLTIDRLLAPSADTLAYHAHSEATWSILETVKDSSLVLSKGEYWYGASGLLKVEMVWPNFEWREANASVPGNVDLHRHLERI